MKYKNFLEKTIGEMEEIAKKHYTTVYISDSISNLPGGYYVVNGKIYYDCNDHEKFDYYRVKAWSRKQAREFYRRINTHLIDKHLKKQKEESKCQKKVIK